MSTPLSVEPEEQQRLIQTKYKQVLDRCKLAAQCAQRDPAEIRIVAVSKAQPVRVLQAAMDSGIARFGENYVQEFIQKAATLEAAGDRVGPSPEWHFIGHLQRNKVKYIAERCTLIHSVDSLRLAEELSQQALRHQRRMDVLLQVNTSGEESKYGVRPEEAATLAETLLPLPGIAVKGLMTIAVFADNAAVTRPMFRTLRELRDDLASRFADEVHSLRELSMGMTNDFETAIAEGATLLRIGTAIFGPRSSNK